MSLLFSAKGQLLYLACQSQPLTPSPLLLQLLQHPVGLRHTRVTMEQVADPGVWDCGSRIPQ